jgi:hypothetical protein
MGKFHSLVCSLLLLLFVLLVQSSDAIPIHGKGTWGSFEGTLTYTYDAEVADATLEVVLTNNSPPANGGYLTGFIFNNPMGKIKGVTCADADFELLGAPQFNLGINAMPLGHFDIGAALGGSWQGGGEPLRGIAVGQTKTFTFGLTGETLSDLNELNFVSELSLEGEGSYFFAARFLGFEDENSDKVPAAAGEPMPVTLSSFTATSQKGSVEVKWTSQSEVSTLAYRLSEVASLDAQGSSQSPVDYRWVDVDVVAGRTYYYKLADVDCQGNTNYHDPVLVSADGSMPASYGVMPNYPNPFNASTSIAYQIPTAGHVSLVIYDVLGRKVRQLVSSHQKAGSHTVQWDSRDDKGREVKSGVYLYIFEAGSFSETRKMVLTR